MHKFSLEPPVPPVDIPISFSLKIEKDGAVLLRAERGNVKAEVLRITNDGRVAFIIRQEHKLRELGFQVEGNPIVIKRV